MDFSGILAMAAQQGGGAAPVSYTAEALALFARMTTPPSTARKGQINTLILSLLTGATSATNIWAKLDVLYVFAAADSQAALLEWKGNTAYDATAVGAPVFTADRGFAGDGATTDMYVDTSYAPGTSSLGMTNGNCHFGQFVQSTAAGSVLMGQTGTTWLLNGVNNPSGRLAGSSATSAATGNAPHHVAMSRSSSTSAFAYRNGVAGAQNTTSQTTALSTNSVKVLQSIAGGTSANARISAAHVGIALNAAEHLDTYNALQTYMTAVGA